MNTTVFVTYFKNISRVCQCFDVPEAPPTVDNSMPVQYQLGCDVLKLPRDMTVIELMQSNTLHVQNCHLLQYF